MFFDGSYNGNLHSKLEGNYCVLFFFAMTPKCDVKAGPTGWHQELKYFVDCVAKGVAPDKYQTIDSVVETMKMVFAEAKSVKSGRKERI